MSDTIEITTEFITSGKRFAIACTASDGRKGSYPSDMSTTKTHEEAARKFADRVAGKDAVLVRTGDGSLGDTFTATPSATPTAKPRATRKRAPKTAPVPQDSRPVEKSTES